MSMANRALYYYDLIKFREEYFSGTQPNILTTNNAGRLFSVYRYALQKHRSKMLSANFEVQLFLNRNRNLWNISDVNDWIN